MDFGYSNGLPVPTPASPGTNFMERLASTTPANITDAELYQRFVDLVKRAPEFGVMAGRALGERAFAATPDRPAAIPRKGITMIEASFGDRGPSKAKRQREDRVAARFDVSLQVSTTADRGVSSASVRARADFYEPHRALKKADELTKATKCLTPFSGAYRAFIKRVVQMAEGAGMLVGFIHTKPPTGGTHYHEFQVILADREGLEAHSLNGAVIMLGNATDDGVLTIQLPATSITTSKGNPIGGKFVMQSRGEVREDHVGNSWATGIFTMQKH